MSTGAIIAIVVVAVVVLIVIIAVSWYVSVMNRIRRMQVKINESASGIDVALTKRFDLLTKQYKITQGYSKHEKETLIDVMKMRVNYQEHKGDPASMNQFNSDMDEIRKAINVAVEAYPDLKANTVFLSLSNACTDVEEHLQASRRLYNANVSSYNQYIVQWPISIIARRLNAQKAEFFKAEESKRADVDFNF